MNFPTFRDMRGSDLTRFGNEIVGEIPGLGAAEREAILGANMRRVLAWTRSR